MQESPKNHKKIYYRLRRSDPHERLGATLRHFSFGAAVFFVVAAAAIVIHSLYAVSYTHLVPAMPPRSGTTLGPRISTGPSTLS